MKKIIIFALLWTLLTAASFAENGGSESPFSLGAGARELSMGSTGAVISDAATSIYWNPALLARTQYISLSGFHSRLFGSDVSYNYAGLALPTMDFGTFGLGLFRLGVDGIEERDERNLLLGEVSEQRLGIYAAYGRWLGNYRVGLSAHLEHHSLAYRKATSTPGLDLAIGRAVNPGLAWLQSGEITMVVRNIIRPGMTLLDEAIHYPLHLDIGTRFILTPTGSQRHRAELALNLGKTEGIDPTASLGAEYCLYQILDLRGGWNIDKFSCGFGVHLGPMTFDYAFVERDLGSTHMFSINMAIGASVEERRASRERHREREFNQLMSTRIAAQNQEMIQDLTAAGKKALASGQLADAAARFDRALFMSRAAGVDTAEIASLASSARARLESESRRSRLQALLDSAAIRSDRGDMVGTRYYAMLALGVDSQSTAAQELIDRADDALQESARRDEMLTTELYAIDSLVTYGYLTEAATLCQTLLSFADNNPAVAVAAKRVQFESWRRNAEDAVTSGDLTRASILADSVNSLYPNNEWVRTLQQRITRAKVARTVSVARADEPASPKLSAASRKEAEEIYQSGQKAFADGDLDKALIDWEQVERMAPDYRSVREYLIRAYKLTGIDLYGKNRLAEAVAIWEKALKFDPGNQEIANYIARTRVEMIKLGDLGDDN